MKYKCRQLSETETRDTKQKVLKVLNQTDFDAKIMFKDQTVEIWAYSKSEESHRIAHTHLWYRCEIWPADEIETSNVTNVYSVMLRIGSIT